jgi:protein-disulfide isomerase
MFDKALESGKFAAQIQRDIEDGTKLGIEGTPTVFINGRRVSDRSYDALKANIEAALKRRQKEARTAGVVTTFVNY